MCDSAWVWQFGHKSFWCLARFPHVKACRPQVTWAAPWRGFTKPIIGFWMITWSCSPAAGTPVEGPNVISHILPKTQTSEARIALAKCIPHCFHSDTSAASEAGANTSAEFIHLRMILVLTCRNLCVVTILDNEIINLSSDTPPTPIRREITVTVSWRFV